VKALLRLYPARWRRRYGDEFEELLAAERGGPWRAFDIVTGALDAHAREGNLAMRRVLPWLFLLLSDLVIGWLNFHASDDVQPVAAALIVAGFGFGAYRPRLLWLYVPLLWLAVPVSGAYADVVNYHPGLVKPHPLYETLVALIPTVIGAAVGALTRWLLRTAAADARR
jgi:hypothetical protein